MFKGVYHKKKTKPKTDPPSFSQTHAFVSFFGIQINFIFFTFLKIYFSECQTYLSEYA